MPTECLIAKNADNEKITASLYWENSGGRAALFFRGRIENSLYTLAVGHCENSNQILSEVKQRSEFYYDAGITDNAARTRVLSNYVHNEYTEIRQLRHHGQEIVL